MLCCVVRVYVCAYVFGVEAKIHHATALLPLFLFSTHVQISRHRDGTVVDSMCRNLTASFIRAKHEGKSLCDFYNVSSALLRYHPQL